MMQPSDIEFAETMKDDNDVAFAATQMDDVPICPSTQIDTDTCSETDVPTAKDLEEVKTKWGMGPAVQEVIDLEADEDTSAWIAHHHCVAFPRWSTLRSPNREWRKFVQGIYDLRELWKTSPTQSEGVVLRSVKKRITWVLASGACTFKVGIACDITARWNMYTKGTKDSYSWPPSHLFILMQVQCRESAGYLEAALISWLVPEGGHHINLNAKRHDVGGTGPRHTGPYFVYLAARPHAQGLPLENGIPT